MRIRVLIVALIAAGVLIPATLILTQQSASAANMVLSILDGTADVAHGAAGFARAADGYVIAAGDRVRTAEQSHAVVTFFDGSTVEVEPATTITVVQATAAPSGAITIRLEQALGRTWSSVQRLARSDSKFELRTPAATATVRGTGFVTDVLASGATTVTTSDGIVEVSAQGQTVVVPAGSFTTVDASAPPSPPVPGPRVQKHAALRPALARVSGHPRSIRSSLRHRSRRADPGPTDPGMPRDRSGHRPTAHRCAERDDGHLFDGHRDDRAGR